MIEVIPPIERESRLLMAGLPPEQVRSFVESLQNSDAVSLEPDLAAAQRVCELGRVLLRVLPLKSNRTEVELRAGGTIVHLMADTTWKFFRNHAGDLLELRQATMCRVLVHGQESYMKRIAVLGRSALRRSRHLHRFAHKAPVWRSSLGPGIGLVCRRATRSSLSRQGGQVLVRSSLAIVFRSVNVIEGRAGRFNARNARIRGPRACTPRSSARRSR